MSQLLYQWAALRQEKILRYASSKPLQYKCNLSVPRLNCTPTNDESRFPLADVLWTLAMALDVYLVTFHRFDGRELRKLEIKYTVAFTVLTFIPAFVFLFIRSPTRGPMYGSVIVSINDPFGRRKSSLLNRFIIQIYCSISPNWTLIRLIFYYVPVW